MQLGEVIRKYRKEKNMTQEEMANRLGVTAPAVNKWENAASMPDILLLAPIARLLDISVDTLLSFQGELTEKEAGELVRETGERLKTRPYAEVFDWAKKQMEQYPNCEYLLLWMTVVLDANLLTGEVTEKGPYEEFLKSIYGRLLASKAETIRTTAADSLYGFYMRKEEYEKAEGYLEYFSEQNPEKKRKQAVLYEKAGRREEACRVYEELLFREYQHINVLLHSLFGIAVKEEKPEKAQLFTQKAIQLARLFDMGEYQEYADALELARAQKDVEKTLEHAAHLLSGVDSMDSYLASPLYEHMKFRELSPAFKRSLKEKLCGLFQNGDEFGYMKGDARWEELVKHCEGRTLPFTREL